MQQNSILESLFDQKILSIIQLFLSEKNKRFYLREISKLSNVPAATTHRILKKLIKLNIIKETKVSKFRLYILDMNENTRFLESFLRREKQVLQIFIERASTVDNVEQIILHGEELKDRANILIIGENINRSSINEILNNINEQYKFKITSLVLTKEQYDQMSAMGLYSGKKKILFSKK